MTAAPLPPSASDDASRLADAEREARQMLADHEGPHDPACPTCNLANQLLALLRRLSAPAGACQACGGTKMQRWRGRNNDEEVGPCPECAAPSSPAVAPQRPLCRDCADESVRQGVAPGKAICPHDGLPCDPRAVAPQSAEADGALVSTLKLGAQILRFDLNAVNREGVAVACENAASALSANAAEIARLYTGLWQCWECGTSCDSPLSPKGTFACQTCGALDLCPEAVAVRVGKAWDEEHERAEASQAENAKLRAALEVPKVWPEAETDGMLAAFDAAYQKHGIRENLFAAAAWLLRRRLTALSTPPASGSPDGVCAMCYGKGPQPGWLYIAPSTKHIKSCPTCNQRITEASGSPAGETT